MGRSYTDRREHERVPVSVELEGAHPEHGVKARMTASNLSLGGMYCVSSHDFPEMTRLAVRMMLPEDGRSPRNPVDLEAVVVRREQAPSPTGGNHHYHLALFFTRIADDDRVAIADYLQGNA